MFLTSSKTKIVILANFILSSESAFNLDQSRILPVGKEFADDNLKFDEYGRKLSKWIENTVGKGEIAHYKQFLLFSQCFQEACFPEVSKGVIVWEWVKQCSKSKNYCSNILGLGVLDKLNN